MKFLLVFSAFLVAQVAWADPLGDEVARLKIKLPEGRLTSNELRQVVQLAHRGGLRAVTEIQPARGQSGDVGLNMHGKPVINGRFVTETILTIWPKNWRADRSRKSLPSYASNIGLGEFLLGEGGKWTREWATFTLNGKTNLLDCSRERTNLAEADRVLEALMSGRIDFKDDAIKERFKQVNVNSIHSIQAKDKSFGMGFNSATFCWTNILGDWKGNRLVIGLVQTICA